MMFINSLLWQPSSDSLRSTRAWSWRLVCIGALAALGTTLTVGDALAVCGDDTEVGRVACSCGDIVASDTVLRPQDPVISAGPCEGDGLLLRAPRGASSLRLDLSGLTIRGSGHGSGLRVLDGGERGVTIIGGVAEAPATIEGFATGVRAHGRRSVGQIRDLVVRASTRNGLWLHGVAAQLVRVEAETNGGDGMRVSGRSTTLSDVRASDNGGKGLRVVGKSMVIESASSRNNGDPSDVRRTIEVRP